MPDVKPGQSEEDFMRVCVPQLIAEGRPRNQAIAICLSKWRNRKTEIQDESEE